jgi:hypothetical protein
MTAGWKVRKTSYTSALWYLRVERGSWYLACGAGRRGFSFIWAKEKPDEMREGGLPRDR